MRSYPITSDNIVFLGDSLTEEGYELWANLVPRDLLTLPENLVVR